MIPDYRALKSEINDPKYVGQSDVQIVESVNAPTIQDSTFRVLSSAEILAWSGRNGRYVLVANAANANLPLPSDPSYVNAVALKSIALVAQKLIDRDNTLLDLNLSDRQELINVLVVGGVLSQSDIDDLRTLAKTFHNRASELGFPSITLNDLTAARNEA